MADITHDVTYGSASITQGTTTVPMDVTPVTPAAATITGTTIQYLIGDGTNIYKNAPKHMRIKIPIPEGFNGDLSVKITNNNFGTNQIVDFCGFAISGAGANIPCIHPGKSVTIQNGTYNELPDLDGLYDSHTMVITDVCHTKYSGDLTENLVIRPHVNAPTCPPYILKSFSCTSTRRFASDPTNLDRPSA